MKEAVDAVYERGVLRPLEPLDLREHERVRVVLQRAQMGASEEEWLDAECIRECADEGDEHVSLESVRRALTKIPGSLSVDFAREREER